MKYYQGNTRVNDAIAEWLHEANKDWSTMRAYGCAPELTMFEGKEIILFQYRTFKMTEEFEQGRMGENWESFGEALAYGRGSSGVVEHEEWIKVTKSQYAQMLNEYDESGMRLYADEEYNLKLSNAMKKPNLTDFSKL